MSVSADASCASMLQGQPEVVIAVESQSSHHVGGLFVWLDVVTVDVVGTDKSISYARAVACHEDVAVMVEDKVVDTSSEELRKGFFFFGKQIEGLSFLVVVAKAHPLAGGNP